MDSRVSAKFSSVRFNNILTSLEETINGSVRLGNVLVKTSLGDWVASSNRAAPTSTINKLSKRQRHIVSI
jgi:hypothetical protein